MITYTTNHNHREVVDASALPAKAREKFDYLDWPAIEAGEDSRSFVKYRGEWIDLGDVLLATGKIREAGWDGFNSDSFWSGLAVRYVEDGDAVVLARVTIEED